VKKWNVRKARRPDEPPRPHLPTRRFAGALSRSLFHSVFAFETLYPARGIDQALLASVERMALGAHLDL